MARGSFLRHPTRRLTTVGVKQGLEKAWSTKGHQGGEEGGKRRRGSVEEEKKGENEEKGRVFIKKGKSLAQGRWHNARVLASELQYHRGMSY